MPFGSIKFTPGINAEYTPTLNEAGISASNLIRFRDGLVEKLGGWAKYINTAMPSKVRALNAWQDLNTQTYLGVGGTNSLGYISNLTPSNPASTYYTNISPKYDDQNVVPKFTTTAGSYVVTVKDTNRNATSYDTLWLKTPISVGGLILSGLYDITFVDSNTYTFNASSYASQTISSTFSGTGTISNGSGGAGTILNITAVSSGTIGIGSFITGTGVSSNTYVEAILTGSGGVGTYLVNNSQNTSSTTISSASAGVVPYFSLPSGSSVCTCVFPNHGFIVGSTATFLTATTIGGVKILGDYPVQTVVDANTFTFNTSVAANSTTTPSFMNGGNAHFYYYIGLGPATAGGGYGAGPYGVGAYGIGASGANFVGTASISNGSGGAGNTLNVTAVSTGNIAIGTVITYPVTIGGVATTGTTVVTAFGSGSGGTGTYTVSPAPSQYIASETVSGTTVHAGANTVQETWSLDNWGQALVAIPKNGPVFFWDPSTGYQTATVIPQAPPVNTGGFMAMPQRQLVTYGSTFDGVQDPLLVRWCDVADYTVWNATSQNQAGSFRIGSGSKIVGGLQAAQQAILWTDVDAWAMQYIQPPLVYGFTKISSSCGLLAQKAAVAFGPNVYWMSQKQFFMMTGGGISPMPCPVWDAVFQNLATGTVTDQTAADYGQPYTNRIFAATNSQFNEVTWYYPSANGGGEVDSYVKFNTVANVWDYGTLTRTAWIDQSVLGSPIGAGIDASGNYYIYQHESNANGPLYDADGSPMNSFFTSGYAAISNGEEFAFVDYMIPDMKWQFYGNASNSAQVNITINVTDYPGDIGTTTLSYNSYGPYTMTASQDALPNIRFRGRMIQFTISSPANQTGAWWRIGNVRYRYAQDGRR